jgi:hypothetical protein
LAGAWAARYDGINHELPADTSMNLRIARREPCFRATPVAAVLHGPRNGFGMGGSDRSHPQ